ncbi:WD40 repeat-like protein [Lophiostoma macrostomum CBS 122681]|uniref:WD40 repeat-like protein n=1 Tax=Lophiostoma macrostomum CBS 122681 TaxID=1314788 RepID=A0A6A6TIT1_9PLEO|nr:WD40 repeat-like protein [Lophiostoma macrostomum CBS 122681]
MASSPQPSQRNLFVATQSNIQFHTTYARSLLFECDSPDGILNARVAKDNSSLLAVADDHVVVLYDAEHGKDRKYTLRSGDGEPRLLLFSPDSRTLYFTTTLSHSIQAYSISTAELLPPLQAHPSPPNVLAISKSGDVLLSASPNPPTIHIHDLRLAAVVPISFFPSHAKSPVACAAFHEPTDMMEASYCLFLLGYQDGTLAIYRLAMPRLARGSIFADDVSEPRHPKILQRRQPIKMGSIKRLHKPAMGGVRAAEFIPGYRARVVSIGYDGKCRIVDFAQGAEILRTWRVSGLPTCLCVESTGPIVTTGRKQRDVILSGDGARSEETTYEGVETLIAIGTQPGQAFIFNVLGLLVREISVDAPVIAIEWVGDMSAPSILPNRHASSIHSPIPISPAVSSQPILEILMDEHEQSVEDDDTETGTIIKSEVPAKHFFKDKSVPFGQAHDFFSSTGSKRRLSSSPPAHVDSSLPRRKRSRKSPTRPRIVTETFSPPSSYIDQSPRSSTSPVAFRTSDARRWSQTRVAPNPPAMSGALHCGSEDSYVEDESRSPDSEVFVTPPTCGSQTSVQMTSQSLFPPLEPVPVSMSPARRSILHNPQPRSPGSPSSRPRKVSFETKASPKAVDGEMGDGVFYDLGTPTPSNQPSLPSTRSSRSPLAHLKRGSTAKERVREMRQFLRSRREDMPQSREEGNLRRENERLRNEMELLRREFWALREAVLVSSAR